MAEAVTDTGHPDQADYVDVSLGNADDANIDLIGFDDDDFDFTHTDENATISEAAHKALEVEIATSEQNVGAETDTQAAELDDITFDGDEDNPAAEVMSAAADATETAEQALEDFDEITYDGYEAEITASGANDDETLQHLGEPQAVDHNGEIQEGSIASHNTATEPIDAAVGNVTEHEPTPGFSALTFDGVYDDVPKLQDAAGVDVGDVVDDDRDAGEGDATGEMSLEFDDASASYESGREESPFATSPPNVTVTWGDEVCPLFKTMDGQQPGSYYLDDTEYIDRPLSDFLTRIRESIAEWLNSNDELLIRIQELGLEFAETTTGAILDQFTFGQLLGLHNTLAMNDGEVPTPELHLVLTTRPNCSVRIQKLVQAANEGRGLSALQSELSSSASNDADDMDPGSTMSSPVKSALHDDTETAPHPYSDAPSVDENGEDLILGYSEAYDQTDVAGSEMGDALEEPVASSHEQDVTHEDDETHPEAHQSTEVSQDLDVAQSHDLTGVVEDTDFTVDFHETAAADTNASLQAGDSEIVQGNTEDKIQDMDYLDFDDEVVEQTDVLQPSAHEDTATSATQLGELDGGEDGIQTTTKVTNKGLVEHYDNIDYGQDYSSVSNTISGEELGQDDQLPATAKYEAAQIPAGETLHDAGATPKDEDLDEIDWEDDEDDTAAQKAQASTPTSITGKRGREAEDGEGLADEHDVKRHRA